MDRRSDRRPTIGKGAHAEEVVGDEIVGDGAVDDPADSQSVIEARAVVGEGGEQAADEDMLDCFCSKPNDNFPSKMGWNTLNYLIPQIVPQYPSLREDFPTHFPYPAWFAYTKSMDTALGRIGRAVQ